MINFVLAVEEDQSYTLEVENDSEISLGLDTAYVIEHLNGDPYEGSYTITPLANEDQVLPTRAKTMEDDLTVLRVPYFETSNIYGDTVYIASEVE